MDEMNEELLRSNARLGIVLADDGLEGTKLETILELRKLIEPYIVSPVEDSLSMEIALDTVVHPERAVVNMRHLANMKGLVPDEYTGMQTRDNHPLSQLTIVNKNIEKTEESKKKLFCNAVCICGKIVVVDRYKLMSGHSRSCTSARSVHGLNSANLDPVVSSTHNSYKTMLERCTNPNYPDYPKWGGRGITVCERWLPTEEDKYIGLLNFIVDMGIKPYMDMSIDRKDNEGSYIPDNSRWATREEQGNNTRSNVIVVLYGEPRTATEVAKELNVGYEYMIRYINESKLNGGYVTPEGYLYIDAEDVVTNYKVEGKDTVYNTPYGNLTVDNIQSRILKETGEEVTRGVITDRLERYRKHGDYSKLFSPTEKKKLYTIDGVTKNATEWARSRHMSPDTVLDRLRRGMSIVEVLAIPKKEAELYEIDGVFKPLNDWCKVYNINPSTARGRIDEGWPVVKAITTPTIRATTATFKGVTRDFGTWRKVLGIHSISKDAMNDRYAKGLRDVAVIRPDIKRSRTTGKLPQILSIIDGVKTVYHDIFHCADVADMLIDDVITELNKENGYIMYMEDYKEVV